MNIVELADQIASKAHENQVDRAGNPYISHPRTVASYVETDEEKAVALLHDVLEDTKVKEKELRALFGDKITDAVVLLTKKGTDNYFEYVERIKENPLASKVKLADLKHNSDITRIPHPVPEDYIRLIKYQKAKEILEGK